MSEFRKDPVSGRWVVIAPERSARPNDFPVERRFSSGGFCPFCEGNEDKTPPEMASVRSNGAPANGPGWSVRVVPNRFPALQMNGVMPVRFGDDFFQGISGFGEHEVVVENPKHVISINEMDEKTVFSIFRMYQDRVRKMASDSRFKYAMIFKNVGVGAGATIEHSHSQIIGMPVVPTTVKNELRHATRFFQTNHKCIFCRLIENELNFGERVIYAGKDIMAITPFASRFPFETWILPKRHAARFEEHPVESLKEVASVLQFVLNRLDLALEKPAYNYLIHSAPFSNDFADSYHWHLEIIPCITKVAGFEWGTGCHINPVLPESAAAFLRDAWSPVGKGG